MTLEAISLIFEGAANEVSAKGYYTYAQRHDASLDSLNNDPDNPKPFPQIQALLLDENGNLSNDNSGLRFTIGFFDQDSPGSSGADQLAIVSSMRTLAHLFMAEVNNLFENSELNENPGISITTFRGFPEYEQMHGIGTGYSIEFTINTKTEC